ncbi:MAG: hypothetical protein JNJ61_08420 [Anaerolineae bacterium]|nr:hypothetical protein [Anaerolineae bacterium]
MGIRYEWADDHKIILDIYLETPWTWVEYNDNLKVIMPMLRDLKYPCATTVNTSKMGSIPNDGNVLENLIGVEKNMPDNVFASAIIAAPYVISVFMNILMRVRPRAQRLALFTSTPQEAHQKIYARYRELYPDLAEKIANQ